MIAFLHRKAKENLAVCDKNKEKDADIGIEK